MISIPTEPNDIVNKAYVDSLPYIVGPAPSPTAVDKVAVFSSTLSNAIKLTPVSIDIVGNVSGVNNLTVFGTGTFNAVFMDSGKFITLTSQPVAPTDAANKLYVDTQISTSIITKVPPGPSTTNSIVRWADTTGINIGESLIPATLNDAGLLTTQTLNAVVKLQINAVDYLAFTGPSSGSPDNLFVGPTQYNGGLAPTNNIWLGASVGKQPGPFPLMSSTTQNNVFMGNGIGSPLAFITTFGASGNVVVGQACCNQLDVAVDNVVVGYQAGQALRGAIGNVLVGASAGVSMQGGGTSGTNNVFVGKLAGSDNTTGNLNVCLGYNTKSNDDVGAVVLGPNGLSKGNNTLTIAGSIDRWNSDGLAQTTGTDGLLAFDSGTGDIGWDQKYYTVTGGVWEFDPSVTLLRATGLTNITGVQLLYNNATGNIGYNASSRRYKQNIVDLNVESSLIHRLQPREFIWKGTGESDWGLIAEEVLDVLPELVVMNESGETETVRYNKLPVLLLSELKRMKLENDELRTRVSTMEDTLLEQGRMMDKVVKEVSRLCAPVYV